MQSVVGLGARNFAAMTASFCPEMKSGFVTKRPSFCRYSFSRHLLSVKANAGSESCVAVKEGFANEEDFIKGGGSELVFVQLQQRKPMDLQSKLSDKV